MVANSHYAGGCLDARCTMAGCPGNTLTVEDGGRVSLFFTHHKCEVSWKGEPVQFALEVRVCGGPCASV